MTDATHHHHYVITPFVPATAQLVDYCSTTGSLLVRGNMPLYTGTDSKVYFAYQQLGTALAALTNLPAAASPFVFSDYTLVDINLTDNQGDLVDLTCEVAAFGQSVKSSPFSIWPPYTMSNPSWIPTQIFGPTVKIAANQTAAGGLVYWPVQACPANLPSYGIYIETVPGYQFAALIDYVHTLLTTGPKRLIYFHCNSGVNRTGAVNVAYFLKYGSSLYPTPGNAPQAMTLTAAYTNADAIAPTNQLPASGDQQLVQVYCNYCATGSPDTASPACTYRP